MAGLLLFDRRVMDRARHLVPSGGLYHITGDGESLSNLIELLHRDLVRSPVRGLRILCHGNSGRLQFTSDGLHQGNVQTFSCLRGLISGFVQLHGCGVASSRWLQIFSVRGIGSAWVEQATPGSLNVGWGPTVQDALANTRELDPQTGRMIRSGQGVQFLIAFANAIGLPVTGAVHAQFPDRTWQFEGPTITAWPLGSLSLHIPSHDTTFGANTEGEYLIPG